MHGANIFYRQAETQAGIMLYHGDWHVGLDCENLPAKGQQLDATPLHLVGQQYRDAGKP